MTKTTQQIAKRWTPALVKEGWTPISTYFLDNYHRLQPELTSLEAMLVIHLMRHKWDERHPHPTFGTLSRRMGVSPTATRNHARSLEQKRFLNRIMTQGSPNQFDLTPLFDALERLHMADEAAGRTNTTPPPTPTPPDVVDEKPTSPATNGMPSRLNSLIETYHASKTTVGGNQQARDGEASPA